MRFPAMTLSAFFALSCGPSVPRYQPKAPDEPVAAVAIWIEEDADLPAAAVATGCDVWGVKGVVCASAAAKELADIRIRADHKACEKNGKGTTTLALAYWGGDIEINVDCFKKSGKLDRHMLSAVVAHEVGHQFGIWEHVPESCDSKPTVHPNGKPVCGQALMNPYYEPAVYFVTPVDSLAFDLRDPFYSVLVSDVPRSDAPDCVYYAP
jgi:hypothetical protein